MARIDLPVGVVDRYQVFTLPAAVSDPTNDHSMVNNGATVVLVQNIGGSSHTAQAVVSQLLDFQTVTTISYTIPANSFVVLGPYPMEIYSDHLLFNTDHADLKLRAFSFL
jgi:hypothetical protein